MNLEQTFAVLKPSLGIEPVERSPSIYEELDARFNNFKSHVLISSYVFESDWGSWERHPAGDELVVLISGSASMELQLADGSFEVKLISPGDYVLVPKNTWHTAYISESTHLLFITPGEGTENR